MVKFLLFIVLAYVAYKLFTRSNKNEVEVKDTSKNETPVELVKDPTCGTFVEKTSNIKVKYYDNLYYFCSEDCRQKFIEKMKQEG
ncbi:MAG: YHS domain-containing protein [Calditerrivibrio sp.]|nr:YHS domain-containing protein [Calditerrivibrio sp.]